MRSSAFPKVYASFEDFERDELRKLDTLHMSIDEMLDEMFGDELNFDEKSTSRGRKQDEDEE